MCQDGAFLTGVCLCCHRLFIKCVSPLVQMATFRNNPHPNENITGVVCSVILNDGETDIKLKNLTEMVEVKTI